MNDPSHDLDRLIDQLLAGTLERRAFAELEARLLADSELRRRFRVRMRLDANLHTLCQEVSEDIIAPFMDEPTAPRRRWAGLAALGGIAAALAIATVIHWHSTDSKAPGYVATIESQEGAAWSGENSVGNGSGLNPGILKLEKGLATLRFESGVLADLEAPVTIELVDAMRCRLTRGKAVFDVPDLAIGFVVETPNGYAVDHGTRFAVALQDDNDHVEFGVLSGRISVHHENSRASADMRTGDMVLMTPSGIGVSDRISDSPSARKNEHPEMRFRANGSETSIVLCDVRDEFLDPSMLMVKRDLNRATGEDLYSADGPKDRRSLIAFELEGLGDREVATARLRLNVVPTGRGYARLLPDVTHIEVYGIRDDANLESWDPTGLKWADAPGSLEDDIGIDESDVRLLGSFGIKRSFLEGPVVFESSELTRFVSDDRTGKVAFLLVSNTEPLGHWSLVHAFASSLHPEAAGPMLELETK